MSTAFASRTEQASPTFSLLTADDLYFFNEGTHYDLWKKLGSHIVRQEGLTGTYFAVWAPNAEVVSVIGDFNDWDGKSHLLRQRGGSGIWEGVIPDIDVGSRYKYHILSRNKRYKVDKADPFAFRQEPEPGRASVVWELNYDW